MNTHNKQSSTSKQSGESRGTDLDRASGRVSAEDGLELDLHLVGVLERRSLRWLAIDLHLVGVLERRD
jgi:hypothetical protein